MLKKILKKLWIYSKPFTNWKFLISFGLSWMVTNGWCYLFILFGSVFEIHWMWIVGTSYAAFLYFPFTVEKLITIPMAIFFQTKFFKNDLKLRNQLLELKEEAHKDFRTVKYKVWCLKHHRYLYGRVLNEIMFDKKLCYERYKMNIKRVKKYVTCR